MSTREFRQFTPDDIKKIETLAKKGLSISVIATRMQRPKDTIANKLRTLNVQKRKELEPYKADDDKYTVYLRQRGYYVYMLKNGNAVIDGVERTPTFLKHKYYQVKREQKLLHGKVA